MIRLKLSALLGVAALLAMPLSADAADWKPQGNVEVVVGAAAGGGSDVNARFLQKILQDNLKAGASVTVVNKPGAGQSQAMAYTAQHPGNGNYLLLLSASAVNPILAANSKTPPHHDFTPIVKLVDSVIVFYVKDDSPIKTIADLMARLKKDVASVGFAFSTSAGNSLHIGLAELAAMTGGDPTKLRFVVNNSGSVTATQVAGGHVDVGLSSPNSAASLVNTGKIRIIGVAGQQRLASYPDVPTFIENGINLDIASWFAVFGPKNLDADKVAFWRDAVVKEMQREDIKKQAADADWTINSISGQELVKALDREWESNGTILVKLGLLQR